VDAALVDQAVGNLVSQFSSALDFYRELVQNSADAGSPAVEVWTEWIETPSGGGTIAAHVDDVGEGMNERIIDDQLTQLFSSAKEGDLTKIGKFGIGFVSVFAPKPQAVLVHTGRDGEAWEVCFHSDRSFTKTRLHEPVEGTRVTLFIAGDREDYDRFVAGSRATLDRWCAHAEVEITFEDRSPADGNPRGPEPINRPFGVEGDCAVIVEHPETAIALAYHPTPRYGFYNKGLAILVTHAARDVLDFRAPQYARTSFKIKSRWLEHTLSRETVIRDENFERAMQLLDAAREVLQRSLADRLAALVALGAWTPAHVHEYERLVAHLAHEDAPTHERLADVPLLRTVQGGSTTLRAVTSTGLAGRVLVADEVSGLTERLAARNVVVLLGALPEHGRPGSPVVDLVARRLANYLGPTARLTSYFEGRTDLPDALRRIVHPAHAFVAVTLDARPDPELGALGQHARRLLARLDCRYAVIATGTVEGNAGPVIVDPDPDGLVAMRRTRAPLVVGDGPRVVLDRQHPHTARLRELARRHPALAVYALAKALLLADDRALDRDLELMELARAELRP